MTSRAKPRFTSRRSRSQPTDQEASSTDTVIQKWAGDQLSRTTWFNVMLKKAAQVFEWKQLVTSGRKVGPWGGVGTCRSRRTVVQSVRVVAWAASSTGRLFWASLLGFAVEANISLSLSLSRHVRIGSESETSPQR